MKIRDGEGKVKKVDIKHRSPMREALIMTGRGREQVFRDKRTRRPKDARNSWQADHNESE